MFVNIEKDKVSVCTTDFFDRESSEVYAAVRLDKKMLLGKTTERLFSGKVTHRWNNTEIFLLDYVHRKTEIRRRLLELRAMTGFKPGYTAPAPLLELGHVPLHFRGNWAISQREHPRFITVVPADPTFIHDHHHHQYPLSSTTSFICCRSLVLIFMALLILRHTLPLVLTGSNLHVFPLFMLFLRILGIMLPIYVVTKAVATCRRHSQNFETSDSEDSSDEEAELWRLPQTQSYIIGVP
ncbi:unnamed protein product [Brassica rapa]|uniref:Transmembrane protein n=1 Tax=Brassica campestris TaxID=3711 RepID=A0A8D9M4S4_BRACM|nr:unnamed protein product [Brassica rapa]